MSDGRKYLVYVTPAPPSPLSLTCRAYQSLGIHPHTGRTLAGHWHTYPPLNSQTLPIGFPYTLSHHPLPSGAVLPPTTTHTSFQDPIQTPPMVVVQVRTRDATNTKLYPKRMWTKLHTYIRDHGNQGKSHIWMGISIIITSQIMFPSQGT